MKSFPYFVLATSLIGTSAAQKPAPAAPGTVTETIVEETVTPGPRRMDPAMTRRQLAIVPRAIPVTPGEAVPSATVVPPGAKVETTETKTIVKHPGQPPRVYNIERSVVVVEGRELPYITVPVLFVKETAELLDADSRLAIQETAAAILETLKTSPGAVFDIEGHTSTDGDEAMNLELSAQRARRVYEELTKNYAVSPSVLTAHGYGESYPSFPGGREEQMILDRRVLVVRVK
jgi:outer membrane protein OmpA-like peptidoglycan-associated protein